MKRILSVLLLFWVGNTFAEPQNNTVVLSEVAWMGTQASAYDEWIELYNYGEKAVDLNGWTIESEDKKLTIQLSGKISAPKQLNDVQRFFLLERTDDTSTSKPANQIYTGGLNNAGVKLLLKDANGNVIDETPQPPWPAGNNTKKQSMERVNFLQSGNLSNNWKSFEGNPTATDAKQNPILGSPKQSNSATPPELFAPKPEPFKQKEFSTKILHIAPTTYNDQPEWFSVKIVADSAVDLTDWNISNGKTTKKMADIFDQALWINDAFENEINGKTINNISYPIDRKILLPKRNPKTKKFEGIFYFQKSPVALYDYGGSITITDKNNTILDQKTFGKATKKTINKQKFREMFVYENTQEKYFLQNKNLYTAKDILQTKLSFPTTSNEYQLIISEIAPTRIKEPDFIEIFVKNAPERGANLKYTEIKHNGSVVLFFDQDYWVKQGDFLLIYFDKGNTKITKDNKHIFSSPIRSSVSTTSGTIEINVFANTSQKEIVDFACWYKDALNKTETKRVQKLGTQSTCQRHTFHPQESLAKNSKNEPLFAHPHGTPGQENLFENIKNFRPRAIITPQTGSKHALNVTGQNSHDPNGDWDIKNIYWELLFVSKDKTKVLQTFSTINPTLQTLTNHKSLPQDACENSYYKFTLEITDTIGLAGTDTLEFPLQWNGKQCEIKTTTKKTHQDNLKKWHEPALSAQSIWKKPNFFEDFEKIGHKPKNIKPPLVQKKHYSNKSEELRIEKNITPEDIRNNIGLIFQ